MNFAPSRTFTIADAATQAAEDYGTFFAGKWHLGALSEAANVTSNPVTHGFAHFNATQEVVPTATTNCNCRKEWSENCNYGHYDAPNHCAGNGNPGGDDLPEGCCFNYWWNNVSSSFGGISNYSEPILGEDSRYIVDSFRTFLNDNGDKPFVTQLSLHNCHIPFIGSPERIESCRNGTSCKAPDEGADEYTADELDYYSCLIEVREKESNRN